MNTTYITNNEPQKTNMKYFVLNKRKTREAITATTPSMQYATAVIKNLLMQYLYMIYD